jgi:hypothetical protein
MPATRRVADPDLERQGRRLIRPAWPFLALAAVLAIIGIVLVVSAGGWAQALGIVLIALAGPPAAVGGGLLTTGGVSRWAARRKPFA